MANNNVIFKTSIDKTIDDLFNWNKNTGEITPNLTVPLSPGTIYFTSDGYIVYDTEASDEPVNLITQSTSEINNNIIYNGTGYKNNYRYNSASNEVSTTDNCFTTGYIKVQPNDILYFYGNIISGAGGAYNSYGYKEDGSSVFSFTPYSFANGYSLLESYFIIDYDSDNKILHSLQWKQNYDIYIKFTFIGTFNTTKKLTINQQVTQNNLIAKRLWMSKEAYSAIYAKDVVDDMDIANTLSMIKMNDNLSTDNAGRGDLGANANPRYLPYKWYCSLGHAPKDGEMLMIKTPSAGTGAGIYLSIEGNNTDKYHPIVVGGNNRLTTHYAIGNIIILVYQANQTANVYALSGTNTITNATDENAQIGIWRVLNYYDSGNTNTLLRVYSSATNKDVPLIGQSSANSTTAAWTSYTGTYKDWYGVIPNDNTKRVKINLSTGKLTVPGGIAGSTSQIDVTDTTPSSNTTYYLTYSTGKTTKQTLRANSDLYYYDTGASSYLNVGSGSNIGGLTLHSNNNYVDIVPISTLSATRKITLPDQSGTLAVTSDITKSAIGLSNVTNHQQVHEVAWDNTNKKITRSKNGTAADVVQFKTGTGISLTAAAGELTIGHSNSIASGTTGTSSTTSGTSISIPYITYDAQGHITTAGTHNHTISASDLGLSSAMHFRGIDISGMIEDGSNYDSYETQAGIQQAVQGDVVLVNDEEFVWTGSVWERLGRDSSFALSDHTHDTVYKQLQTAVSDSDATVQNTTATEFISKITQNAQGIISVEKKKLPTYNNYSHPTYTTASAAAVKVGRDSTGHVVIGDNLTKTDVGLSNVENTALSTWSGSSNIITLGTITTGTWNGTTIAINKGGTGGITAEEARANLSTWNLERVENFNTFTPSNSLSNSQWFRFGKSSNNGGLIPSVSGSRGSGHDSLGSSTWYWNKIYVDEIYTNCNNIFTGTSDVVIVSNTNGKLGCRNLYQMTTHGPVSWSDDTAGQILTKSIFAYWDGSCQNTTGSPYSNLHYLGTITQNLLPTETNTYNLGADNKKWATIYATTFNGNLSGNATTATRANLTTTINSIAYYSDTIGTFATKPSANGVLYATSDNGNLQWGTLPIAQGGTGATGVIAAKENLGLGVYYTDPNNSNNTTHQNFYVTTFNGPDQLWGIGATVLENRNITNSSPAKTTPWVNKRVGLVIRDKGLFAYNNTGGKDIGTIWDYSFSTAYDRINFNAYEYTNENENNSSNLKSSFYLAKSVPSDAVFTDTKNTAGSTNNTNTLYLIGAISQGTNPQTYSNSNVYINNGTLTTQILNFKDSSNQISSSGATYMSFKINNASRIVFTDNELRPAVNDGVTVSMNLGSNSIQWNNVYATTFHGSLDGNATTATQTNRANLTTTINSIAYYSDTTGTFASKASAKGALYATQANGELQWGILPTAQGGTGHSANYTIDHLIYAKSATELASTPSARLEYGSGIDKLILGFNSTGSAQGILSLWSKNTNYKVEIQPTNSGENGASGLTADRDIRLPDSSGKIVLIPTNGITLNRLIYSTGNSTIGAGAALYTTGANLAINKTSITSGYNFEVSGDSRFIGNLIPSTTNSYDLGTSSFKWANIYATNFKGNIQADIIPYPSESTTTYNFIGTATALPNDNSTTLNAGLNISDIVKVECMSSQRPVITSLYIGKQQTADTQGAYGQIKLCYGDYFNTIKPSSLANIVFSLPNYSVNSHFVISPSSSAFTTNRLIYSYNGNHVITPASSLYTTGSNLAINQTSISSSEDTNYDYLLHFEVKGKTHLHTTSAASDARLSSQLIISNMTNPFSSSGSATALELWRGTGASWQIINTSSGQFKIRHDYTTALTTYQDALTIGYNEGNITIHSVQDTDATKPALTINGGATIAKKLKVGSSITIGNKGTIQHTYLTTNRTYELPNLGGWLVVGGSPASSGSQGTGSNTQPIFLGADGILQPTLYSLNASIGSGNTNYLAMYTGSNSIGSAIDRRNTVWIGSTKNQVLGLTTTNGECSIKYTSKNGANQAITGNWVVGINPGSAGANYFGFWDEKNTRLRCDMGPGVFRLYKDSSTVIKASIKASELSSSRIMKLPDLAGTFAMVDDNQYSLNIKSLTPVFECTNLNEIELNPVNGWKEIVSSTTNSDFGNLPSGIYLMTLDTQFYNPGSFKMIYTAFLPIINKNDSILAGWMEHSSEIEVPNTLGNWSQPFTAGYKLNTSSPYSKILIKAGSKINNTFYKIPARWLKLRLFYFSPLEVFTNSEN